VVTAQFDPLWDASMDFARRLAQAGVPTELHLYPRTPQHSTIDVTA
jgi:acetyl esterase/lipase